MSGAAQFRVLKDPEIIKYLSQLAVLDQENMTYYWSKDQWGQFVRGKEDFCITAAFIEKNIHSFSLWQLSDPDCAHLLKIITSSTQRNKGMGKKLLKFDLMQLREAGFQHFYLEVAESNSVAINLYQRAGFEKIHLKKRFYSDGSNAYAMQLSLN